MFDFDGGLKIRLCENELNQCHRETRTAQVVEAHDVCSFPCPCVREVVVVVVAVVVRGLYVPLVTVFFGCVLHDRDWERLGLGPGLGLFFVFVWILFSSSLCQHEAMTLGIGKP